MDQTRFAARRAAFRAMHTDGCFVLPNPWDAGSAVRLEKLGFRALASTSAGLAWSLGREDYGVTCSDVVTHLRALCAATALPVNADFEDAFATDPAQIAANVTSAVETGIAGLSVEDRAGATVLPIDQATARIAASRAAIDRTGTGAILVARSEGMGMGLHGREEAIERLRRFAAAGADCLYAVGLETLEDVASVVGALAPHPVNVLRRPGFALADLARLGVRRVSLGGALARIAWTAFDEAAATLAAETAALEA